MKGFPLLCLLVLVTGLSPTPAQAQSSSFTYQGQLRFSGQPFTGTADLEFRLYDQLSDGTQIGSSQSVVDWPVEDGLFRVELDFGSAAFDGSERFLEVRVDGAPLSPRQPVTATPYALLAAGAAAGSVDGATIDPAEVQVRVTGTCPSGEFVQQVAQDGSVVCGGGGSVTQVDTGAGLTGGPITDTGTIAIAPGGIGAAEIDGTQVQLRVVGTCPAGEFVREVNADGTVLCDSDADSGGTLTQVDTGAGLTGGPITETGTISVAPGGIGTAEIDASQVQARVNGSCPAGQYLQQVNSDGSVSCVVDADSGGTVTEIQTGAGLTGGPISTTGTVAVAPGGIGLAEIDPTVVQRRVTGICPPATYLQTVFEDGTVGCGADAQGNDWRLGGNAGTNPATDFIGTTDATPFEIRTDGARSMRIEPSTVLFDGAPITATVIAGSSANEVAAGVRGAKIGGGGVPSGSDDPSQVGEAPNRIHDHYGVIDGGFGNTVGDPSSALDDTFSTIGGGKENLATGLVSTIAGGSFNETQGSSSSIGGGTGNSATGSRTTIAGGGGNTASGNAVTISGGGGNSATGNDSTIGGGGMNEATQEGATIAGGRVNVADGFASTISGGVGNEVFADYGAVGGGRSNTADGSFSSISGGDNNCAGGDYSWAGGSRAKVRPGSTPSAINSCFGVAVTGDADGDNGTFIWADDQGANFISTGENQFLVRANGGVGLGTNAPQAQLHVTEALNASADSPGNHVAIIENTATSTGNGPDVLALKTSAISPTATANLITFFDGNDDPLGRIDGNGSGGVVLTSGGADFAEWLPKRDRQEIIEPGDLVGWHADGISHDTEGALRVMAVSTKPIVAGNAPPEGAEHDWARVGFIGQVPVRVRGPVSAGEWIVASGREDGSGVAVAAESLVPTQLDRVVGQALASADETGEHRINVAVGLGHDRALANGMAVLQAQNAVLRDQLAAIERRHGEQIAALQEQRERDIAELRGELAVLLEAMAPRIARTDER